MNRLVLIIIAVFFPPIAVLLDRGLGKDLLINIVLCLILFLPGMIHALYLVTQERDRILG